MIPKYNFLTMVTLQFFLFHKKDAQRKCSYMIIAMITLVYFTVPISLYYG